MLSFILIRSRDLTLNRESRGEDVVDAVIGKIRFYLNESSDYNLMRRTAAVESYFGQRESVMNENPNGGIWQVNIDTKK